MPPRRIDTTFMSGVPELLILHLLARREMYGYELVAEVRVATGERIRLGEGVVYPQLHALERSGLLKSRRETVSGRPRVYYRLSAKGRRRLARLRDGWHETVDAVTQAIDPDRATPEAGHAATPA